MKNKIFITTDSEIDDKCSMIRLLFYTDKLDIRGLVSVNSKWQKDGHGELWIHDLIDMYALDYSNAIVHSKEFTSPNKLHSVVRQGYVSRYGLYMDEPDLYSTPGSDLLIKELINDDLTPLHICMWGSGIMISYVFNEIKKIYNEDLYIRACKKAKLFYVDIQEFGNAGAKYIRKNHPTVENIISYQFDQVFNYRPRNLQPYEELMGNEFVKKYILNNNSHLADEYLGVPAEQSDCTNDDDGNPLNAEVGIYISEGDSISFFHAINTGLKGHLDPRLGSLAGRFEKTGINNYDDAIDNNIRHYSFARNTKDLQYDFANRVKWFSTPVYDECIHYPFMNIVKSKEKEKYIFKVSSSENSKLNAYVYKELSTPNFKFDKINDNEYELEVLDNGEVHVRFECVTDNEIYLKIFEHQIINNKGEK